METKALYETGAVAETLANGSDPPARPDQLEIAQWVELDRVVVQIVVGRHQNSERGGRKVGEVAYNPATLFADPEASEMPWGTTLEKLIAQALLQAEQGQG